MTTKLEAQIDQALRLLPTTKPKHFIVRPARPKGGKQRHKAASKAHRLEILSLHDAQARCSCGGWDYMFSGARTRKQIQEVFRAHLHLWKPRQPRKASSKPRRRAARR